MILHRDRRPLLAMLLVMAFTGVSGLGLVARAMQTGEIFSPASGHAQVIAQGVAALPGEVAWRAVFHSLDPGGATEIPSGEAGFLLVDTGGYLSTTRAYRLCWPRRRPSSVMTRRRGWFR